MPSGSVIITPGQMYNEIQAMGKKLDHLAAVIDPAFSSIRDDVRELRDAHGDHEVRLRSIEKRLWLIGGAATAAGAGLSQLLPIISR